VAELYVVHTYGIYLRRKISHLLSSELMAHCMGAVAQGKVNYIDLFH
jgi:hypothetical protein